MENLSNLCYSWKKITVPTKVKPAILELYLMIRRTIPNNPAKAINALRLAKDMHLFNIDSEYNRLLTGEIYKNH